jgi:flagellar biogenesis protein FliO
MGGLIQTAAAHPARLGGGAAVEVPVLRIVVALILCAMVAVLAALWLKRRGGWLRVPSLRAGIEVVESRRLGQHADLSLVRVQGREYAILCGPHQHRILSSAALPVPGAGE